MDSAIQGVTLSLLWDHFVLLHPVQSALIKQNQPVDAEEPQKTFEQFKVLMTEALPNRSSGKHLAGRELGRMEPTLSLKYQKQYEGAYYAINNLEKTAESSIYNRPIICSN